MKLAKIERGVTEIATPLKKKGNKDKRPQDAGRSGKRDLMGSTFKSKRTEGNGQFFKETMRTTPIPIGNTVGTSLAAAQALR